MGTRMSRTRLVGPAGRLWFIVQSGRQDRAATWPQSGALAAMLPFRPFRAEEPARQEVEVARKNREGRPGIAAVKPRDSSVGSELSPGLGAEQAWSSGGDAATLDVVGIARESQAVQAELLNEQVERALDALIACRLSDTAGDLEARRR